MFKKRPNFLNSAPTRNEGALRLLSAPSGRFWQQTAICTISVWALVVELHPLNWARAQAVRRISDNERAWRTTCVCGNFAANLVKILQRRSNCLTKHTGRTAWKGLLEKKKRVGGHGWVGQRSRWCWFCFFDWKGIVHHEFVPRGQMVNKQFYQEVLARLRNAVRRKRTELWENQTWMLHHDNAPA